MRALTATLFLLMMLASSCNQEKGQRTPDIISDDSLLTLIQYRTFQYFWDGAEPVSGLARERIHMDGIYPENDQSVITSGGSGFGVMAILTGIERGFISRKEGFDRFVRIVDNLEAADRFHGAWAHWMFGETGKAKPFSPKDNGADIVETAYLMQGLLTVRQYFASGSPAEQSLSAEIDTLWREVEWNWFTRGGEDVIYWHWSPDFGWEMNFPVQGYNECLILYVLAASSPTYPVSSEAYHNGWARSGGINAKTEKYGRTLGLKHNGSEEYGGPLFWSHYSFLGLDPRNLTDSYASYWLENSNHTMINYEWCCQNPGKYRGYGPSCWGLTASYSPEGYAAHSPGTGRDLGVISPTAAISSVPYTPEQSMAAIRNFYYSMGDRIFGEYGFYDAFSIDKEWYPQRYLAIDQGPEIVMIENHRSGLLWNLFMSCDEVRNGLKLLGFSN